jgi:hypothetical protein
MEAIFILRYYIKGVPDVNWCNSIIKQTMPIFHKIIFKHIFHKRKSLYMLPKGKCIYMLKRKICVASFWFIHGSWLFILWFHCGFCNKKGTFRVFTGFGHLQTSETSGRNITVELDSQHTKPTKAKRNRLIWRKWKEKNKRQNEIKK